MTSFLKWYFGIQEGTLIFNKSEISNTGRINYDRQGSSNREAFLISGFYMLEVSCKSGVQGQFNLCLLRNRKEINKISLGLINNTPKKRVVFVDSFTDSISSDTDSDCIVVYKFTPLPNFRAKQLMVKKIETLLGKKKCITSESILNIYGYYVDKFFLDSHDCYSKWLNKVEGKLWSKLSKETILFSIIVPVYNASREWLDRAVNSVANQNYRYWELILVDDCSTSEETVTALTAIESLDSRIKVIRRTENGNISAATNDGIERASGDFITFLDHDDSLAPQALNEVAAVLSDNPSLKLVYSDEDLVAENDVRVAPHFKSDWNPDLLFSHNYITHLAVYRRDLIESLGGCRVGCEGAQDYDLALRATAQLTPEEIHHIPKVLYHWYMVEGSTATSSGAKNYALESGLKAITERVESIDALASVETTERDHFFHTRWSLPAVEFTTSVIIPTRDGLEILRTCIDSLVATADCGNLEIVIVDNGSIEPTTLKYFEELQTVSLNDSVGNPVLIKVVCDDGDFNFSRLMNLGAEFALGEFLLLLNNDTEFIERGWLRELVSQANRKDIGCVGAKLLYPDRTIQHAGVILGLGGYAAHSHRGFTGTSAGYFCRADVVQNLSAVTAACLMVRREVYEQVDGFDVNFAVAYNDVDFCLRVIVAGYRNLYTPYASLIHHESKTRGEDITPERAKRFDSEKTLLLGRWYDLIQNDPYYNPNLTKSREDFSIKRPHEYPVSSA